MPRPPVIDVMLILEREAGASLLGKHAGTEYDDGRLNLPSGNAEPGDNVFDAIVREAREEIDIALDPDRLAEPTTTTTRKIVGSLTPTGSEPPAEPDRRHLPANPGSVQRAPHETVRARELHEFLGLPTDEATVHITRSHLGRLARQGVLTQPGRDLYQKRM
ncbi:NUDIX domain-containing protein (plasmid) [Embleya sp. NBC_00888]|uniref:NUDIX domain-containing protein n=1 Tax=Embleya sp. NBC_00888 TaxID=2975960 RepID=UPI002F910A9C|nr:NUDIX domain-containing protein [Embleya sp. NBC_00888]